MGVERIGQYGAVGFALENVASWGAEVAPAFWTMVDNINVRPEINREVPANIRGSRQAKATRDGGRLYSGTFTFDVQPQEIGALLKAAFGTVTTSQVVVGSAGGGNVYQHRFTAAETVALPSFCLWQDWGVTNGRYIKGCRVNQLTIGSDPRGPLKCTVDLRAISETATSNKPSASYSTLDALHHNGFTATTSSAADNTALERAELRLTNNLEEVFTAGNSGFISRCPATGFAAEGTMRVLFVDETERNAFLNDSAQGWNWQWSGTAITSGWSYSLLVEWPALHPMTHDLPIAPGVLREEIGIQGIYDSAAGHAMRVVLTNATSGY